MVLAVDAGQSGVRAAIVGDGDSHAASGPGVPRMDGTGTGPQAVAVALLKAIEAIDGLPDGVDGMAIGLSGFEVATEGDLVELSTRLTTRVPTTHVAVCTDGVTSLLGALAGHPGAVVAAGTGTVAMAFDGRRWARVDGVGPLLGDAGSGFRIGAAGLDSALRLADGRGGSEALAKAAVDEFGPLGELPRRITLAPAPAREIAAFAPRVAAAAGDGDRVALEILTGAGRDLAESVVAAARRLFGPDDPVEISYAGRAFEAGSVVESFTRSLAALWPHAGITDPAGGSLAGAARLARRADAIPAEPGILWRRHYSARR